MWLICKKLNQEIIFACDLNESTGGRVEDNTVGSIGEEIANDNGERPIKFC